MKSIIPLACSVCFGDPNSSMTKGAMMGVFFLLGVVLFVLGAIASVAVIWARRGRKLLLPALREDLDGSSLRK